ncbi:EF-hand domain-containing protein [Sphingopyxis sp. J-6]|uniref:EF-hand domain-containing protein n=1 Tax=Sphingopyxis sp. J-6 TaxID=3122054 RepID=UPI003983EB07
MKKLTMIAASLGLAFPAAAGAQPADDNGRIFAAIDTNGDGKLDKVEVTKMAEARAKEQGDPSLAAPEKIDSFIKHIDANGDGAIDRGEIETVRKARAPAPPSEELQDAK